MLAGSETIFAPQRAHSSNTAFVKMADADKERVLKDDKSEKRLLWVSHMTRIRDTQDKAAFAELYAHFAPRVKGFLMKSGSDASLAEECAQEVMATCWHKAHLFDPSRASVATWDFYDCAEPKDRRAAQTSGAPSQKSSLGGQKKSLIKRTFWSFRKKAHYWVRPCLTCRPRSGN